LGNNDFVNASKLIPRMPAEAMRIMQQKNVVF